MYKSLVIVRSADRVRNRILQARPTVLVRPLLKQSNRLALIRRGLHILVLGKVWEKVPLGSEFSQDDEHVVPVGGNTPGVQSRILGVGIEHCRNVERCHVFDINFVRWKRLISFI